MWRYYGDEELDQEIIEVVRELQRTCFRVYPWMVSVHLRTVIRPERTLRRDMSRLARLGRLERVGVRKGYRAPRY